MNKINYKNNGFTLIELMISITVAMILMSIAAPSLTATLQKNKITAMHNKLLSGLSFARNSAITTGSWATLCHSNSAGTDCENTSSSWANGWIVFSDRNRDGAVNNNENVLSVSREIPSGINIFSTNYRVSYGPQGYALGYAGNITLCATSNNNIKGRMIISANGRVRKASDDDTFNCPNT